MKAETTKRNIKNAFLALSRKTPVNKISITNLVVHANVSRGTFYTYYDNIQDMLEDIGLDLLRGLDAIWQAPVSHHSILHILPSSEQFVQYFGENRDIFLLLLGKHGSPSFSARWMDHLHNALAGRLRMEGILPTAEMERVLTFIVHHGIYQIRDAFFTEQFAEATFHTLSVADSVLYFIVCGHQQQTSRVESVHEREREREQTLSSYLY